MSINKKPVFFSEVVISKTPKNIKNLTFHFDHYSGRAMSLGRVLLV